MLDEQPDDIARGRRRELMGVVDGEQEGTLDTLEQLGEARQAHRGEVRVRQQHALEGIGAHRLDVVEREQEMGEQRRRVVVGAPERHPCARPFVAVGECGEDRRLPVAGGRVDEDAGDVGPFGEVGDRRLAAHDPRWEWRRGGSTAPGCEQSGDAAQRLGVTDRSSARTFPRAHPIKGIDRSPMPAGSKVPRPSRFNRRSPTVRLL